MLWNIEVAIHISVRLHYTLLSTQTFVYGTRLLYYYIVSEFLFFVLVQGHVYIRFFLYCYSLATLLFNRMMFQVTIQKKKLHKRSSRVLTYIVSFTLCIPDYFWIEQLILLFTLLFLYIIIFSFKFLDNWPRREGVKE